MLTPSIKTWSPGDKITATELNRIRDALFRTTDPPSVHAYRSAALNHATTNSTLVVPFDAEDYDVDNMRDGTNPSRVVIPEDGRYLVMATLTFASNTTGYRALQVRVNSAGSGTGGTLMKSVIRDPNGSSQDTRIDTFFKRRFVAGDYLELFGYQNSGAALAYSVGVRSASLYVQLDGTTGS